jgi:hypothetical protein
MLPVEKEDIPYSWPIRAFDVTGIDLSADSIKEALFVC